MIRAAGPRAPLNVGSAVGMWWALGVFWGVAGLTGLVWVAARIAAAPTGGHVPPFGVRWVIEFVTAGPGRAWPGTPTALVAVFTIVLGGILAGLLVVAWRLTAQWRHMPADPVTALARNPGIKPLTPAASASTAIRLRPSLAGTSPAAISPAARLSDRSGPTTLAKS